MIVAAGTSSDGRELLVLGLTAENIRRLQAGQPIDVPRSSMESCRQPQLRVLIAVAENPAELTRELDKLQA